MLNIFINLAIFIVSTSICAFALEYGIRSLLPHYDPSGHVGFITDQSGLVVAKNKGKFRQIKNTGSISFCNDGHWTKEGHQLAAEELKGKIFSSWN